MVKLAIAMLGWAFAAIAHAESSAPRASFDCAQARTDIELAICSSPELVRADRRLGVLYEKALRSDPSIKQEQRDWIKRRNIECGPDTACLLQAARDRIARLRSASTCTTAAQVSGLDPNGDGFLAVRSGPSTKPPTKRLAKLRGGTALWVCARNKSGRWLRVRYPADGQIACLNDTCSEGWVASQWVESRGLAPAVEEKASTAAVPGYPPLIAKRQQSAVSDGTSSAVNLGTNILRILTPSSASAKAVYSKQHFRWRDVVSSGEPSPWLVERVWNGMVGNIPMLRIGELVPTVYGYQAQIGQTGFDVAVVTSFDRATVRWLTIRRGDADTEDFRSACLQLFSMVTRTDVDAELMMQAAIVRPDDAWLKYRRFSFSSFGGNNACHVALDAGFAPISEFPADDVRKLYGATGLKAVQPLSARFQLDILYARIEETRDVIRDIARGSDPACPHVAQSFNRQLWSLEEKAGVLRKNERSYGIKTDPALVANLADTVVLMAANFRAGASGCL